jgi:hypothetical protein
VILLETGQWVGRGSVLAEGQSRGAPVSCRVRVTRDDDGASLNGHWQQDGGSEQDFAVRVAANDSGTYTLGVRLAAEALHGTAKLDSPPNAGLLWNDPGTVHVSFALFAVPKGYGFRGFVREAGNPGRLYTWEIAFTLEQAQVRGDNIVSLNRRRR